MTLRRSLALALVGAALPWVLALVANRLNIASTQAASEGLAPCLILTGFLFVPASIFAPVVGAMFPSYWAATPVTIIRSKPFERLLQVMLATVAYGVSAIGVSLVTGMTWLVLVPMVLAVGLGGFAAIRLVAYSLAIFDPILLAQAILDAAPRGESFVEPARKVKPAKRDTRAEISANDLCRLARGLCKRDRPTAAAETIHRLRQLWEGHPGELENCRELTTNVLEECMRRYGTRADVSEAVKSCRLALAPRGGP